jgi:hypothetical protein
MIKELEVDAIGVLELEFRASAGQPILSGVEIVAKQLSPILEKNGRFRINVETCTFQRLYDTFARN